MAELHSVSFVAIAIQLCFGYFSCTIVLIKTFPLTSGLETAFRHLVHQKVIDQQLVQLADEMQ
jgi:hypothetical protein